MLSPSTLIQQPEVIVLLLVILHTFGVGLSVEPFIPSVLIYQPLVTAPRGARSREYSTKKCEVTRVEHPVSSESPPPPPHVHSLRCNEVTSVYSHIEYEE